MKKQADKAVDENQDGVVSGINENDAIKSMIIHTMTELTSVKGMLKTSMRTQARILAELEGREYDDVLEEISQDMEKAIETETEHAIEILSACHAQDDKAFGQAIKKYKPL